LLGRSIVAFLLLPGTVAFAVPILLAPDRPAAGWVRWWGPLLIAAGTALLLRCARDFHVRGRGTLAPWAPPRRLVRTGPYALSRNPMYVAVLAIVIGWAIWFASPAHFLYAGCLAVAFQLRILLYEEPRLRRGFPDEWRAYVKEVPRWVRLRPRGPDRPPIR
jgi:protein-S-isoprenylcysteine O-methyltransferase Ste14